MFITLGAGHMSIHRAARNTWAAFLPEKHWRKRKGDVDWVQYWCLELRLGRVAIVAMLPTGCEWKQIEHPWFSDA